MELRLSGTTVKEARLEKIRTSNPAYDLVKEDNDSPIVSFDYPNYNLDPKPKVMVLGDYTNPDTQNTLIGGLNLNYMTDTEVGQLRKALPLILKAGNLKERYWAGRKILPDIFKSYYRTYNRNYASSIIPVKPERIIAAPEPQTPEPAPPPEKKLPPIKPLRDLIAGTKEIEKPTPGPKLSDKLDIVKKALAARDSAPEPKDQIQLPPETPSPKPKSDLEAELKLNPELDPLRGSVKPEIMAKTEPAISKQDIVKDAIKDKLQDKIKEKADTGKKLEKKIEKGLQKPPPPPKQKPSPPKKPPLRGGIGSEPLIHTPEDDVFGGEDISDTKDDVLGNPTGPLNKPTDEPKLENYKRHRTLGLLWESPASYRFLHRPSSFLTNRTLQEDTRRSRLGCPLLAIVNTKTGEALIDRAHDHSQIISDADWNYRDIIRLLPIQEEGTTQLLPLHDGLPDKLVTYWINKLSPTLIQALTSE